MQTEKETIEDLRDYFHWEEMLKEQLIDQHASKLLNRLKRAYHEGQGQLFYQVLADTFNINFKILL